MTYVNRKVVQVLQKGIKPHMQWYFVVRKQEHISFRATDPADPYSCVAPNLTCQSSHALNANN